MPIAHVSEVNPSFTRGLPLTRAALELALERHAGQLRGDRYTPFVQHPLEVASLLSLAGYEDAVWQAAFSTTFSRTPTRT